MSKLNDLLKHHVTGAIKRGEKTAIKANIPFKIGNREFTFHSGSAVYGWNGSYVSNIPVFVRGFDNEHAKKGVPGKWYMYGSNYKRPCTDCNYAEECPELESILESEYQKQVA